MYRGERSKKTAVSLDKFNKNAMEKIPRIEPSSSKKPF